MADIISIPEVLIKVGRAIAADGDIAAMCVGNFGRGCQVVVGNYSDGQFKDSDAPFVWVSSDDEDANATNGDVTGLVVKIVAALCPMKDIPSTDEALRAADAIGAPMEAALGSVATGGAVEAAIFAAADCGTEAESLAVREAVDAARLEMQGARDDLSTAYFTAKACAEDADVPSVLDALATCITKAGDFATATLKVKTQANTAAALAEAAGEEAKASAATSAGVVVQSHADAVTAAKSSAATERTKLSAAYDAFDEDPYIREVVSARTEAANGLTISGAIRILDALRAKIYAVINREDFGIPVSSVSLRNKSSSHYPLDWTEISVTFGQPETL